MRSKKLLIFNYEYVYRLIHPDEDNFLLGVTGAAVRKWKPSGNSEKENIDEVYSLVGFKPAGCGLPIKVTLHSGQGHGDVDTQE
jgi:hypothetical protein